MKVVLACLLLLGFMDAVDASAQQHKELRVAAASDLQPVMPAFAAAYEKKTGVKLKVSFASSSALTTQILNGAPFDVFLAADFLFPEKVVSAGLAEEKSPVPYARGTLVLWARKDSPIQPLSTDLLTDPRVTRIAVGDEFHAPYGRAAYATMRWMKTLDRIKAKLVVAENISQAAQFVESGNAQLGFISMTAAKSPQLQQVGNYVPVPRVYPKIEQCAVILKNSPEREAARAFLAWLLSPEVQSHLSDFGLTEVR